jgi:hypothetical protein
VHEDEADWHSTVEKKAGFAALKAIDYKGFIDEEYSQKY